MVALIPCFDWCYHLAMIFLIELVIKNHRLVISRIAVLLALPTTLNHIF